MTNPSKIVAANKVILSATHVPEQMVAEVFPVELDKVLMHLPTSIAGIVIDNGLINDEELGVVIIDIVGYTIIVNKNDIEYLPTDAIECADLNKLIEGEV